MPDAAASSFVRPTFDEVYAETFRSVWAGAKRLRVPANAVDDVVQEVFVAVHRQLGTFRGGHLKAWVFSFLVRAVSNYRRTCQRKGAGHALASAVDDPDSIVASGESPLDRLLQREAAEVLRQVLDNLGEARASLFVMSEVQGMTAPEISSVTDANLSTVYGRIRAMRIELNRQLELVKVTC
ncbi:MAG TPA: RNA polymerase sigma factor [Polyangiaceae bacterium]|nr:RNA polymerase sigma factor [Polyangiaceae bacterium]